MDGALLSLIAATIEAATSARFGAGANRYGGD
jgi:hypothetical protein